MARHKAPVGLKNERESFGLGHVGCVTAACLAKNGHTVWGVDVNPDKVAMINEGKSPIVEAGLAEMILENRRRGALRATTDPHEAVRNTEISLVCVGTPSNGTGSLDLRTIKAVPDKSGKRFAATIPLIAWCFGAPSCRVRCEMS
jgi:GDP-mannose 6-dehydrogenase